MIDKINYIETSDRKYPMICNINVLAEIQEKYGDIDKWAKLIQPAGGLPKLKDLNWSVAQMINEAIDIECATNGTTASFVTEKQVGRILTEVGMKNIGSIVKETVVNGMGKSEEDPNVSTTQNQQ